jgi:hypothetical protein
LNAKTREKFWGKLPSITAKLHSRRFSTSLFFRFHSFLVSLIVALLVEAHEQEKEGHCVDPAVVCHPFRIITFGEQELRRVCHHNHELDNLNGCQALFHHSTNSSHFHGCDCVVEVHDDVDEGVQEDDHCSVTDRAKHRPNPSFMEQN